MGPDILEGQLAERPALTAVAAGDLGATATSATDNITVGSPGGPAVLPAEAATKKLKPLWRSAAGPAVSLRSPAN